MLTNYRRHRKIQVIGVQMSTAGGNHWRFNEPRVIMIYVARQNFISPVHVDLNCGKTVSRAPPDWIFFPFAISPGGLLTVRCHSEQTESRKKNERHLTLLDKSNTTGNRSADVKSDNYSKTAGDGWISTVN